MHFTKPCLLIGALLLAIGLAFATAPASAQAVNSERTLVSGGLTREFILHVPKNAPAGPKPLVIALHGAWQPAGVMQRYLDLDKIADRDGFIVAYPKGLNLLWNDGRATVAGIMPIIYPRDDGRFIVDVLETLEAEGLVDPSRVYLMGFSNGGFLTAFIACRYADRFAAYATMMMTVPVGYNESCRPSRPVPILMMNGTYDPIVPMFGRPTPGARLMSADESAALFARLNGCGTPQANEAPHARILWWQDCAAGSAVAYYRIEGGHQPPAQSTDAGDALAAVLLGPRRSGLDAPQEIWSFFQRFTLPTGTDAPPTALALAATPPAAAGALAASMQAAPSAPGATRMAGAASASASAASASPAGARPILQNPNSLATAWQGIAPEESTITAGATALPAASVPLPIPSPLRPRRAPVQAASLQ